MGGVRPEQRSHHGVAAILAPGTVGSVLVVANIGENVDGQWTG